MPAMAQPIRHTNELRILSSQPGRYDGHQSPMRLPFYTADNRIYLNVDSALLTLSWCHRPCSCEFA